MSVRRGLWYRGAESIPSLILKTVIHSSLGVIMIEWSTLNLWLKLWYRGAESIPSLILKTRGFKWGVRAISLWHLEELYGRLITVNSNCKVIKDPCLHKALNFCYNYCYVQGVDSLQKISVQLCRRHYPISIKLGREKYISNRFPIVLSPSTPTSHTAGFFRFDTNSTKSNDIRVKES